MIFDNQPYSNRIRRCISYALKPYIVLFVALFNILANAPDKTNLTYNDISFQLPLSFKEAKTNFSLSLKPQMQFDQILVFSSQTLDKQSNQPNVLVYANQHKEIFGLTFCQYYNSEKNDFEAILHQHQEYLQDAYKKKITTSTHNKLMLLEDNSILLLNQFNDSTTSPTLAVSFFNCQSEIKIMNCLKQAEKIIKT